MMSLKIYLFVGPISDDGPNIEEFMQSCKYQCPLLWRIYIGYYLEDEAVIWWMSLDSDFLKTCLPKEILKLFLDKWSHNGKKENNKHKGLFSVGISLLQVHACIQKEKIIVSINPSCKHNFINVNVAKKLQVLAKHIAKTQVDNEDVQIYKHLKIYMDKYVFHSDFYTSYMDNVDVVLGYPWIECMGTVHINVQKEFMKLLYKMKKIAL